MLDALDALFVLLGVASFLSVSLAAQVRAIDMKFALAAFVVFAIAGFDYVEGARRLLGTDRNLARLTRVVARWDPSTRLRRTLLRPRAPLDVLLGAVYLTHHVYPALYLLSLLWRDAEHEAPRFLWIFGVFSVAYFWLLVLLPVSPPWAAAGDAKPEADFRRFDERLGVRVFARLYARPHALHAAFPSGHVAWSCLVLAANWREATWPRGFTLAHTGLVAVAAVYSRHHWLVDCVGAVLVALAAAASAPRIQAVLFF